MSENGVFTLVMVCCVIFSSSQYSLLLAYKHDFSAQRHRDQQQMRPPLCLGRSLAPSLRELDFQTLVGVWQALATMDTLKQIILRDMMSLG